VSSKPCSVEVVYTDPFLALLQQEHPDAHRRLLAAEVYEAYFESNRAHADQIKEAVAKDSIKAFVKKAKAGKVYLATMIDLCLMLGPDPSRKSNHPTHEWLVALTDVHVAESDAIAAVIKATLEERCRVAEQADTAATTFDFLDGYIMRLLCEPVQTLIDSKRFGHVEKLNDKLHADCEWYTDSQFPPPPSPPLRCCPPCAIAIDCYTGRGCVTVLMPSHPVRCGPGGIRSLWSNRSRKFSRSYCSARLSLQICTTSCVLRLRLWRMIVGSTRRFTTKKRTKTGTPALYSLLCGAPLSHTHVHVQPIASHPPP
jgi:hypothetical protein